jgi:hypothetical protein
MAAPTGQGWRVLIRDETSTQAGQVFWKRWGEGFTDSTTPIFTASSGTASVVLSVWRGCDTDPIGLLEQASSNGSGTTLTAPAVTALTSASTVVRLFNARVSGTGLVSLSEGSTMYSGGPYSTLSGTARGMAGSYLTNISIGTTGTATVAASAGSAFGTAFTVVLEANQSSWSPGVNFPIAWFDGGNNVILVSGAVNRWGDKTGNGFDVTATVSPTWSTTGWNGNKPAMVFASNQYMISTAAGFGNYVQGTNQPYTIFATVKYNFGSLATVLEWSDNAIANICSNRVTSAGLPIVDKFTLGAATGTHNIANANKRICITSNAAGSVYYLVDDATEINGVSLAGTLTTIDKVLIGNNWNVANACGTLAEIIVYNYENTANFPNYRWYSADKFGG